MTLLDPDPAVVAALTTALGVALTRLGLGAGLLRVRGEGARCASCRRSLHGASFCRSCARR